ncbi:hypothetical protein BGZ89_002548 [Linnemannia elongata]|nr:hypothetical protein BGZ89_002548 [Linnemannia elongata]
MARFNESTIKVLKKYIPSSKATGNNTTRQSQPPIAPTSTAQRIRLLSISSPILLPTTVDLASTLSRYHGHEKTFRQPKSAKLVLLIKRTNADQRPPSFLADQAAQDSSQSIITACDPMFCDAANILFVGGIQAAPDIEHNLHQFRDQRLKARENSLFVPPQAKPMFQSSDEALVPLMEMTLEFLSGSGQVLLLLGDSGAGKSTFNLELEQTLWKAYKRDRAIPLYINLPAIDNPQQFSDVHTQELKQNRQFIIICDEYDESQLKKNIYHQLPTVNHFHEAVIASFSRFQIEQYVEQYAEQLAQKAPSPTANPTLPSWTVKDYMDKLNKIPKMIELVSNPFLLTLALRTLPRVILSAENLSNIRLTRIGLYDNFIEQWLETNKLRLEVSALPTEAEEAFDALLNDGFVQQGVKFQKDLATAIFFSTKVEPRW